MKRIALALRWTLALVIAVAVCAAPVWAIAEPGATTRVSLTTAGVQTNSVAGHPSVSEDGRYVAFESNATNLVPGDGDDWDIFVHDRVTGATTLESVNSDGIPGIDGPQPGGSRYPVISPDGRYVAFCSLATNLAADDTNGNWDVFVRDRALNTTTRASVSDAGAEGNSWSQSPAISADGRFVVFQSAASNLVPGDTNEFQDVFVRDLVTSTTTRVSVNSSGEQGNSHSGGASISTDGRYVSFESIANNLVPGETSWSWDVFVYDRTLNTTALVSVDRAGSAGGGNAPAMSADGRYVAFESASSNLVDGDTNGSTDVFVRDFAQGTTKRVSVDSADVQGNGSSSAPSVSADGRHIAFQSDASNLVSGDTNAVRDVFVHNRVTGVTTRASVDSSGGQGNGASQAPYISSDGRSVSFASAATNLVSGDTNSNDDVFVRELENSAPVAIDDSTMRKLVAQDGEAGDIFGNSVAVSGDTAVIGAEYDDDNGVDSGSAYVYVRSGTTWTQQTKLVASDGSSRDYFGFAVALAGDTALISAYRDDDRGSVYVFTRSGSTWIQQAKLLASDGVANDGFGTSLALSGDTALIGATYTDDRGVNSGSAYVFDRVHEVWTQRAQLVASDGATYDFFGDAVAISGDTAVVGAPYHYGRGANSGAAYVFTRLSGGWTQRVELAAQDGNSLDYFGDSVAVSNDTALIGAVGDDGWAGSVCVFVRSGSTWVQQAKLVARDRAAGDAFGNSVAVSGDTAVIGAAYDDDNGADSGSAYVFSRTGKSWMQLKKLVPRDNAAGDLFGSNSALSGGTAIVSSHLDSDKGIDSGSALAVQFVAEDSSWSEVAPGVLGNDSDLDADTLTAELMTAPSHGTVALSPDGSFTFAPAADWYGTDAFTYRSWDGRLYSEPATVTIIVTPVNDPPVAVMDIATCGEDSFATLDVLANDADIDTEHDVLLVTAITGVAHGTLDLSTSGVATYTPDANWFGADSFTYRVFDGELYSGPATVTITVSPVNDDPTFTPGGDVTVDEDSGPYSAQWAADVSPGPLESEAATFTLECSTPSLFSVRPTIDDFGRLTFTPATNAFGSADATVTLTDAYGAKSAPSRLTITVSPVNDDPTFTPGGDVTVDEDSGPYSAQWAADVSPGPLESEAATFTLECSTPSLFSVRPTIDDFGRLTFTPATNAFGSADATVTLTDAYGAKSAPSRLTITVSPVNDDPTFTPGGDVTVDEDSGPYSAQWAADVSPGPLESEAATFTLECSTPSLFSVRPTIDDFGRLTFTPATNAFGSADATVTLTDAYGAKSAPSRLTITVSPVNDDPTFTPGGDVTVDEDSGPYSAQWAADVSPGPLESEAATFTLECSTPSLFSVRPTIDDFGRLTFTPATNAFGSADATVTLTDAYGAKSAPSRLTISVMRKLETPTSVSLPGVSPSRPIHGKYATFTAWVSPGAGAVTGVSTLRLYRYETKTVHRKVRGRTRHVRVKYWRLRNTIVMSADTSGLLTARGKPGYSGKWMAQVVFSGSATYTASASGSRTFTVR